MGTVLRVFSSEGSIIDFVGAHWKRVDNNFGITVEIYDWENKLIGVFNWDNIHGIAYI